MGSFASCIQMNAYAYEHCPKREIVDSAAIAAGGTCSGMEAGTSFAFERAARRRLCREQSKLSASISPGMRLPGITEQMIYSDGVICKEENSGVLIYR